MIKLTNVNKYYNKGRSNEIHVLNDISLEFPNTSLVSVLGKSGSGKSTLLNVIGGLDKASGQINYNDELIVDKYSAKKIDSFRNDNIGYIFQNYHLIPELSVYENLVYALELIGVTDEEELTNRIDNALELVGMKRYKKRNALALSGGQQQRVAIARALVKGAKTLIADEPTGNLDSENTIEVMNILKEISKTKLVLLVTHNKEIATDYSDRIISLVDGKVVEDNPNTPTKDIVSNNTEVFSEVKKYEYNFVAYFFKRLKLSLKQFFKLNIKQFLINSCFVIIGILLTYNMSLLSANLNVDEDSILSGTDYEGIYIKDSDFDVNELFKSELEDVFFAPMGTYQFSPNLRVPIVYSQTLDLGYNIPVNSVSHYSNLIYTKELKDNEILVSKYAAETIVKAINNYKVFDEKELINYEIILNNETYKIVGVESNLENNVMISNVNKYLTLNHSSYYFVINRNNMYYSIEDAKNLGVQFEEFQNYNSNRINVYINGLSNSEFVCNEISTNLLPDNAIVFATKADYEKFLSKEVVYKDYELSEGTDPILLNDIILPDYFKDSTIESIYSDYNITGYYKLNTGEYPCAITSIKSYLLNESKSSSAIYYTNDLELALSNLNDSEVFKDFILDNQFEYNKSSNELSIIAIVVLIFAIILILFFVARAKMLTKIKTIGIYRSLGSSKLKIYLSFLAECLVLITFTTIAGLIFVNLSLQWLCSYIPLLKPYKISFIYNLLGVIGIYSMMILASLLPVFLLLRKTPIEITSKYDI